MLGWCPRPSLQHRTSGRSCISHNHEIVHFSSAFEDEKPVLQPPHQIVIGFDLGSGSSKSLLTQACESPRSVLEPHHLHRPQPGSPRSPLSALGSLLADCTCVRSTIKAEEITSEVHTYHPVLKSEHVVCGADRVRAYDVSDPVARPNHGRVRASKNQPWEGRSCVREGFVNRHSSAIFSSDDDDDDFDDDSDVEMSKSIFCAASPVSDGFTSGDQPEDFLSKCFRCSRRLGQGKDIYMYRGDQAFCSQECRYKQIVADERKDKSSAVAPPFFRVTGGHHTSVARVAQAALG